MGETLINSDRIAYFRKFGEGHYHFACQAAVPLLLTPDLLYKLWRNFKTYKDATGAIHTIPYLVVSDLLLSNLCRTVGQQLYKMEEEVRLRLLRELDQTHKCQLAEFLRQYAERSFTPAERSIQKIHLTTAKSFLDPGEMAREIREDLLNRDKQEPEKLHLLNLYYQLTPQAGEGTELGLILQEARADAGDVLEIHLPGYLREKVNAPEAVPDAEFLYPGYVLDELHEVKKFDLSNRDLDTFPVDVFQFVNLEELYLNGNRIEEIPPGIGTLTRLKVFAADNNRIRTIPPELLRLPALEQLSLSNNRIRALPVTGIALPEIALINLSFNELTDIPIYSLEELEAMGKLKQLYLRENQINEVPDGIGYLTGLEVLNLRGNRITALPASIRVLKQLKTNRTNDEWRRGLDLRDNPFTGIEPAVFDREPAEIIEAILERQWATTATEADDLGEYIRLGDQMAERGDYRGASKYYHQAISGYLRRHDERSQGEVYQKLGFVAQKLHMYESAKNYYEKALSIYQDYQDGHGQGQAYQNLGVVAQEQGDYEAAKEYYQKALAIFVQYEDVYGQGQVYYNLGMLLTEQGRLDEAEHMYRKAIEAGNAHAKNNLNILLAEQKGLRETWQQVGSTAADAHVIIEEARLKHLRQIDLGKLGLTELPDALFELTHLKALILGSWRSTNRGASNRLRSLPERIGELTNLEEIYLSDNEVQQLPEALGKLRKLRVLSLSRNGIRRVPTVILKMYSLQQLYLSGNPLETVPTAIVNLPNLRELGLNGVTIAGYPDEIAAEENGLGILKEFFRTTTKIAIVDDHRLFRRAMIDVIKSFDRCHVLWEAGDGREATERIVEGNVPDVVILDDLMPGMDGYETLRWLKGHCPEVKALIATMFNAPEPIEKIMQLGAHGCFLKSDTREDFEAALQTVAQGGYFLSESVRAILGKTPDYPETASPSKPDWSALETDAPDAAAVAPEAGGAPSGQSGLAELYTKRYPSYLALALAIVKDREEASDIVSNVFAGLLDQQKTFADVSYLNSYIRLAVKNAALDFLRKRDTKSAGRNSEVDVLNIPELAEEDDDPLFSNRQVLSDIISATKLSKVEKEFLFYVVSGFSNAEIAERMKKDQRSILLLSSAVREKLYKTAIHKLGLKDL